MDDPFRKAEQLLSEASDPIEIKRAVSGLLLTLFQGRRRTTANMAKIMVRTLGRSDDLEGQRELARALIQMVEEQLKVSR